ncbi:FGGY-family carbohydrate kinase [Ravibacter arvi]|uniref:FGGY-family carbohydrate kinase n=2 Tax=Ravibacter arvi TaxID=2051041 RepID=A0ABP8LWJ2_9BACT
MSEAFFLGIDVGTQGVRVILTDEKGVLSGAEQSGINLTDAFRTEQDPHAWWEAVQLCVGKVLEEQPAAVRSRVAALSVTSTSGTVIPLDKEDRPLHAALMYSDTRQEEEGRYCRELALTYNPGGFTAFNASSGLSKILWFAGRYPEKAEQTRRWVHAADYIFGMLSGDFSTTDYTNALKTGYDVAGFRWPSYITEALPVEKEWLQEVVPSGKPTGVLLPHLANRWRLGNVRVVAGMTDGCASQVAAGAVRPGDWNTTIGTTLVVKGVTLNEIKDPLGRLYSHRHPAGAWMPGGASNTGADWISREFGEDLQEMNREAAVLTPTHFLSYPLRQKGERFPFVNEAARGFTDPSISTKGQEFAAGLEGVAYVERLAYRLAEALSGERVQAIYSAGGGSNSDVWMQIRADVLNRPVLKTANASGAMGAAVLAASQTRYSDLAEAAGAMTHIEAGFDPRAPALYEDDFGRFENLLRKKGYLKD